MKHAIVLALLLASCVIEVEHKNIPKSIHHEVDVNLPVLVPADKDAGSEDAATD